MTLKKTLNKSFFIAAMGTMMEYYDYALFSTFLPILAPLFFPGENAYQALSNSYYAFLTIMLLRPLGGFIFGTIGDKFGRRKALLYSMIGIALATLIIGFMPTVEQIGISATIIIVIIKSLQILFFGGELNGAGIFVVEHADKQHGGMASCFLVAMTLTGSLVASAFGIVLTTELMPNWSWRIAFYLGGIFGLIAVWARKHLLESPHFNDEPAESYPLGDLFSKHWYAMIFGVFTGAFATIPFSTVLLVINPILVAQHFITAHQFMVIETVLISIAIATLLIVGYISTRIPSYKIMIAGSIALIGLSAPLLTLVDSRNLVLILFSEASFIIINEISLGPAHDYFKYCFPMHLRYRGVSISFGTGMSVLGGITPIIENYSYTQTNTFHGCWSWLVFIGCGYLLSLIYTNRRISACSDGTKVT